MIKKDKHQCIYNKFKSYKETEGFELKTISEIFIPFWYCKQKIVVEKDVEVDRFSKIILELINNEISTHSEICNFLGINENDFTTMQFHFLIKNELIEENFNNRNQEYKITHKGISFLKGKRKIKNLETVEFEYLYNDLSKEFCNSKEPFDKKTSKNKSKFFSGYQVNQTNKLNSSKVESLPHKNRPSLNKINQSDFASFFNSQKSDMTFYDFENSNFKPHKRSILFLKLEYENDENQKEYEIRQFKSSVNEFDGNVLEENLSVEVMKYYKEN